MVTFPWHLITIDIDGTLTTVHGWEVFARHADRLAEYEDGNRRFFAGEVGEDEHLKDLLNLAEGLSRAEVEDVLERTPRLSGIREAIGRLHDRGCRAAILTHNPSYVCHWYQRRFGFDDWEGADGTSFVAGRVPRTDVVRADKVTGLSRLLARQQVDPSAVAHVGDGLPDASIFPMVGGGVAVNSSNPAVDRAADVALRLTDLRPLVPALESLKPRAPVKSAPRPSGPL